MPRKRTSTDTGSETLRALWRKGADSEVLQARLAFAEADGFRKYVEPLVGVERVHPGMLPTQASGRWSTTDPPLVNFPKDGKAKDLGLPELRRVVVPDPGWYWLAFDFDAIEARMAAAYSKDEEDLAAFALGHDIHTLTACQMLRLPVPPDHTKALHSSGECAAWRAEVGWAGDEDPRRTLYKTARYALIYGTDERAILNAPGVEKLGIPQDDLLNGGRRFLAGKPRLVAWKRATWTECRLRRVSRTILGRRRVLWGEPDQMAREGLNHKIQGWVADLMNLLLAALVHPRRGEFAAHGARLGYNAHDGAKIALPQTLDPQQAFERAQPLIEKEWDADGVRVSFPASVEIVWPDGTKGKVKR